jgi:acyl dehydratase
MNVSRGEWADRVSEAAATMPRGELLSRWFTVSQEAIDLYAASVEDQDPLHVDAEWASANAPYEGTIAAGMWGASLLVAMLHSAALPAAIEPILGTKFGLNYGFDRVRFMLPLRVRSDLRGRFLARELRLRGPDRAMLRIDAAVEMAGQSKPALIADWLIMYLRPGKEDQP